MTSPFPTGRIITRYCFPRAAHLASAARPVCFIASLRRR